jgi:citrate lyase subunit beta/citryl-CoA lyase/(S)-citramalyl-CoA lyase
MNPRRCLLFVPGSRPERFGKALASDADQVAIDLEDAVPPEGKSTARAAAIAFLASGPVARSEIGIRVNGLADGEGQKDIAAIAAASVKPAFVMLPKTESAEEVRAAAQALPGVPLIALLESPRALFAARAIAAAPNVQAMMFGGYDYAVAARCRPGALGWAWPRGQWAAAAAEADVGAIDAPSVETRDLANLGHETGEVMALGFTAKSAIHPAQVAPIQSAFLPTQAELEHARKVVAAAQAAGGGVAVVDGRMVDRPVERAALRVIEMARFGLRED